MAAINFDNLVTTTPSRFSTINPLLLGPMAVLETISTENMITARMAQLVTIWASYDPPNAAQYDVGNLEFDPIRINQELNSFFELLVRDRVNQAARSVTLAFAVGTDLDAIASRYPGGVPRLAGETDTAYQQRIWMSVSALSLNGPGMGTYDSYVFWTMSAPMPAVAADGVTPVPAIRHASAFTIPGTGQIYIAIMSAATSVIPLFPNLAGDTTMVATPIPTSDQIAAVYQYITASGSARKGLTDVINVLAPKIVYTTINVQIWLFPGVDQVTLMNECNIAMSTLVQDINWLGADLTLLSINGALAQVGVYNTKIISPAADIIVGTDSCIVVTGVTLQYIGTGQ